MQTRKAAQRRDTAPRQVCQLVVSAQDGAWRDRQSTKQNVQRPECNACDAVHVIANQGWHGKNSDLAGRLIESTGHSRRIVEGPEGTPQLLQKADGRSDAQEGQSEKHNRWLESTKTWLTGSKPRWEESR